LISYLREKLSDKKVFDDRIINQINRDLDRLGIEEQPYLEDDIFQRIRDRIVDWCIIYQKLIPHEKNVNFFC
jgi:hypothetical protein